jgi:hypothetical protein
MHENSAKYVHFGLSHINVLLLVCHQSNFHVRGKHDTRWTFPMFHELIISICIHIYMRLVTERSNQRWTWNTFIFMFLTCLNLGQPLDLTKIHKKFKNIVFLCHTVNIQVDKTRSKHIKRRIMYLPPNPKLCLLKSNMKIRGFGFTRWKFQKPPKSLISEWLRRIHAYLFIFMFWTCLILVKPRIWPRFKWAYKYRKKSKKIKNKST